MNVVTCTTRGRGQAARVHALINRKPAVNERERSLVAFRFDEG